MDTETLEEPKEKVKSMFCEVDRANVVVDGVYKNHISSSRPPYMLRHAMEQLEQSVDDTSSALDEERVNPQALEFMRRKVARERKRLHDIKEQTPRFSQTEMQHISNARKDLDVEIASALYSTSDMEKGIPDPQKEADRMSKPCIKIDPWLAESCNIKLTDGKCTRSQAEGARQMAIWHESGGTQPAHTEDLRRDMGNHLKKSSQVTVDIDLKALELEKRLDEKIKALEAKLALAESKVKMPEVKETYTCPDCEEIVNVKGKSIHDARWCKAKHKKE